MSKIRLDKFISSQLNISRNDAKKLIRKSSVNVNGILEKNCDCAVDTSSDTVIVNGKQINYKEHLYIMMNKPSGVVSSTDSPGDITVIDILPDNLKRQGLFPAGRLDKDTIGFMLITDDGEFAHSILSPSRHVEKTYIADVKRELTSEEIKRFTEGMLIGTELFKPAGIKYAEFDTDNNSHKYEVKIIEGRYHQIKRMFISCDNPVVRLKRIAIGKLYLDDALLPGEAREISDEELNLIKN